MTNKNYDWKIGLTKTLKNATIWLLPSLVAWQATIDQQYAAILSIVVYGLKNWIENS